MNTTRVSLIARIHSAKDSLAWGEFVEIYGPLLYRYGRNRGLQDTDAQDLSQDVLHEVSKAIAEFTYDPDVGRFRGWLFGIARHRLSRMRRSEQRQPVGSGDTQMLAALQQVVRDDQEAWETEYRRNLIQWAANQIREEFHVHTWQAFSRTAIDGDKAGDVADELGISIGSVYVAKNRVLSRLRKKIRTVDESVDI